jgi:hypothetical protein
MLPPATGGMGGKHGAVSPAAVGRVGDSAPPNLRREVTPIYRLNDWLERHALRWLFRAWCWPQYRLFGRCWAQGCGRRPVILHTPRQLRRCESTPMAIGLTARGWLLAHGMDAAAVDAWCRSNGVDPAAIVRPVPPATDPAHVA